MIVMFALGRARGQAWDALFVSAISLAIAAGSADTIEEAILPYRFRKPRAHGA